MSLTDDVVVSDQLKAADIVRQRRGMEPINPHKIEGFGGPGDPPAPSYDNPYPPLPPVAADDVARHEPPPLPSPLMPRQEPKRAPEPVQMSSSHDLQVIYNGVHVMLSGQTSLEIIKLILSERKAEIEATLIALNSVTALAESVAVNMPAPVVPAEPETPKRGRGRPKGSRNKPKGTPDEPVDPSTNA